MPNTKKQASNRKNGSGEGKSRGAQRREELRKRRERQQGGDALARPIALPFFMAGCVLLIGAAAASGALVFAHVRGEALPGCGPGSGCEAATNSIWGTIPGINWPTSFVGFAYFAAMLVAWIVVRKVGVPAAMRWIARLGLLASIFLVGVIVLNPELSCKYCLASHAMNLLWVVMMEVGLRTSAGTAVAARRAIASSAGSFLAVSGLLLIGMVTLEQASEREFERTLEEIGEDTARRRAADPVLNEDGDDAVGFRGKYIIGPADAPVRFVVYSDYQCPDCKKVEQDILQLLQEYPDTVSLSHKHFPMHPDCNPHVSRAMHGNACWAARAAEAAGILGGTDAFWKMHYKLFEIDGSFTQETFPAIVAEMGFDYAEFVAVMQSDEAIEQIREDADEAVELGLHYTPFVFVNGTEIKNFNLPNAMRRAVEFTLSQDPPRATHAGDRPPPAIGKFVADWKSSPRPNDPLDTSVHTRGAGDDAIVELVVYTNHQGPAGKAFEEYLADAMMRRPWVRYTFRHFPFDQECNPGLQSTRYEQDCEAARATEAAAILGGEEAFWKMRYWLIENEAQLANADIWDRAAEHIGVEGDLFRATMLSSEVEDAVQNDIAGGTRLGVTAIPSLHLNGRKVPRWLLRGQSVLGELFDAAYEEEAGEKPPTS